MSLEQAILDRLEKRNAQIEMLQQTIQAMSHAADAEREHTRQQLGPLIEENKKLAAQTAAKCDELAKATARIKPLEALYKTLKGWQENDHIIGYGLTIDTAINKATEALSQLTA